ncbi:TPA: response regulator transcription factor [Burkholderia cepacia ATCC 25416]|nr:response regulator transcription factor [Burkholderia cepacia ATCC 25416]
MKLLLIEDDPDIAINLRDFLEMNGHQIELAADGLAGRQLAASGNWDAILLDLWLPGMNGLELCRDLRDSACDTPILMLTARDTLADKLEGFARGADDYLVKPFAPQEVEARLVALVKRASGRVVRTVLRCADLQLDTDTLELDRAGRPIKLPPKCLHLLRLLMASPNRVFRRRQLEAEVWGTDLPGSDTLRTHMYILRRALTANGEADLIETVHGHGYRLLGNDAQTI